MINENSYIWSDLHLGHKNILNFEPLRKTLLNENSSLDLLTQHDNYFIEIGNSFSKENTLLNLGDFSHNSTTDFLKRIIGKNILLRGNHDKNNKGLYENFGIKVIDDAIFSLNGRDFVMSKKEKMLACYITDIKGIRIMFSHFPIYDENPYDAKFKPISSILEELYNDFNCQINIHGHTHSKPSAFNKSYNVSVENINFKPKLIKDILEEVF